MHLLLYIFKYRLFITVINHLIYQVYKWYWITEFIKSSLFGLYIIFYRCHPCLWKTSSKDYINYNLKITTYKLLVELCKKHLIKQLKILLLKNAAIHRYFLKDFKKVEQSIYEMDVYMAFFSKKPYFCSTKINESSKTALFILK